MGNIAGKQDKKAALLGEFHELVEMDRLEHKQAGDLITFSLLKRSGKSLRDKYMILQETTNREKSMRDHVIANEDLGFVEVLKLTYKSTNFDDTLLGHFVRLTSSYEPKCIFTTSTFTFYLRPGYTEEQMIADLKAIHAKLV